MMKIKYFIALCSFIIFFLAGFVLFQNFKKNNVLGVTRVTRLKKENYIFPQVGSFKLFYEPSPNTEQSEGADFLPNNANYTINKDSLNERYDYSVEKPKNTYRIVTIGDSFTYGEYVDTNKNYSEVLEDLLNTSSSCHAQTHFDVINLGVPGYDIGYTVQRFISRGMKYNPDLVVWLINPHNMLMLRDIVSVREEEIRSSSIASDDAKFRQNSELYFAGNEATRELLFTYGKKGILKQQLEYFHTLFDTYKGSLLIVVSRGLEDADMLDTIHQAVDGRLNTWVDFGLPNLDELKALLPDSHPNAHGHEIIASHMNSYLKTLPIYPCK